MLCLFSVRICTLTATGACQLCWSCLIPGKLSIWNIFENKSYVACITSWLFMVCVQFSVSKAYSGNLRQMNLTIKNNLKKFEILKKTNNSCRKSVFGCFKYNWTINWCILFFQCGNVRQNTYFIFDVRTEDTVASSKQFCRLFNNKYYNTNIKCSI